jgi:hypothetical protein
MNEGHQAETETAAPDTNRMRELLNDEHATDVEIPNEESQFRDAAIESPQLPFRMRFNPPVEYDGTKYTELIFDFDSLIGKDFQRAERTFQKMFKAEKNETPLPEMKHLYQCILAAQVADVPVGLIMKLPRRYYTPLRLEVLKACGSSPDEDKA